MAGKSDIPPMIASPISPTSPPSNKQKKKTVEKNITRRRSVRLFSTKSFKPLGTLVHHKAGIQALSFAHAHVHLLPTTKTPARRHHHGRHRHHHYAHLQPKDDQQHGRQRHASTTDGVSEAAYSSSSSSGTEEDTDEDEDDEMTMGEKTRRARWLVSGGKDGRVAIWELMDFNGARSGDRSG
jgi:hypothetical protein